MSDARLAETMNARLAIAPPHEAAQATSLLSLLETRAAATPERTAFTFLADDGSVVELSYGQLAARARQIAVALQQLARPNEPVLLVYPAGLEFIEAFFGCVYAGVLAVPSTYPKPRRPMPRLATIAHDCGARIALTTDQSIATLDLARVAPELGELTWLATDTLPESATEPWQRPHFQSSDLAFLQYTSGSTSHPKGVMVSHGNLLSNLEAIRQGFAIDQVVAKTSHRVGVFWLPAYHDMGLIGGLLEAIYVGGQSVLMSPAAFLQRPLRWLQAISEYGASVSGAPNFAYELCLKKISDADRRDLDLSSWRVAFSGAEPIQADTLARFADAFSPCGFSAGAFYPCYGLAEATLLAAGGEGPATPRVLHVERRALAEHRVVAHSEPQADDQALVGCGHAPEGHDLAIVDPQSGRPCNANQVGEVWVAGPSVAGGYWNRLEESSRVFRARIPGRPGRSYLRTGDLGFVHHGQLYVTGRIKDVIIIRGRNHYPQDIEQTVGAAHPAVEQALGAALPVEVDGEERLVVVHEVNRQHRRGDLDEVAQSIRRAIAARHELNVHAVVLIRPASLPTTTSGKVQRHVCRQSYLADELKELHRWTAAPTGRPPAAANRASESGDATAATDAPKPRPARPRPSTAAEVDRLAERIEAWLLDWLTRHTEQPASEVHPDKPFADYGLDSISAVEMSHEIEDWLDVQLTPVVAWNYPTPRQLAPYLARLAAGWETDDLAEQSPQDDAELEALLSEIEGLDEDQVAQQLEDDQANG